VRKTPEVVLVPPYRLHRDKSLCSIKVASEKDAVSAQKLSQFQPSVAIFPQGCRGRPASFRPSLTPSSLGSTAGFVVTENDLAGITFDGAPCSLWQTLAE
jgi:hypothetical protein